VISKDKIKEVLGRSPDYADTLMMRMWFELRPRITNPFNSLSTVKAFR
jgi:hypothetical protein